MILVFSILWLLLIFLGCLSLGSYVAWWYPIELISHFRTQYLCFSLIISALFLLLRWQTFVKNKILFLLGFIFSLMLVGLNAVEIIPWYLPNSQQISANSENKVRFLSFNINVQNQQYEDIINVVRENNPDVALFMEIEQDSVNKLKPGLNEFLPYSFKSPGGGLALFSRLPIQDARGDTLNFNSYNLLATIEINQKPVQLIATHPVIPVKMDTFHRRNRHLDVIADFVKQETLPLILLGDFNLTPWSPYYRRFTKKTGLHNASLGYGIMATYPRYTNYVRYPKYIIPLINIPIDHCFVSQEFKVANYRVGNNANSDHAPIIADLVLSE